MKKRRVPLGYYNFTAVSAGETYVLLIRHKQFQFSPSSQIVNAAENEGNINFTPDE